MQEEVQRECKFCGKSFTPTTGQQRYCCDACRYRASNLNKKDHITKKSEKAMKKRVKEGLVADTVEARKLGMTYGQYKAMQYVEEKRKEEIKKIMKSKKGK